MVDADRIARRWRVDRGIETLRMRFALALVLLAATAAGVSAQSPCDPELLGRGDGPQAYADRGDRCEGVYSREVRGSTLYLVSLTRSFEEYTDRAGDSIFVTWPSRPGDVVRIRAEGIRRGLYYQMDTRTRGDAFAWALEVLGPYGIGRSDLGVLGWTTMAVGGTERTVRLPLRVSQTREPAPCEPITAILWNTTRLTEVEMSLAPVASTGVIGPPLIDRRPLGHGYYPAQAPVVVRLPPLPDGGLYRLKFDAWWRDRTTTVEEYFFDSGEPADCSR
jgi:hypothetical protein